MFREIRDVPQEPGGRRRWFRDPEIQGGWDLIIWYDDAARIRGFQLCYERAGQEHALTWRQGARLTHQRVDNGEGVPMHDMTPILVPGNLPAPSDILDTFVARAAKLDHDIVATVTRELRVGGVA